jgi:hypothetical protein
MAGRSAEFNLERIAEVLVSAGQGSGIGQDFAWRLSKEGRIFYASDADQNDFVTGQTSFVNTTPTFLLRNPSNSERICIPLLFSLNQAGTVGGGVVSVSAEIDNADVYSSGGTVETVLSSRPVNPVSGGNLCTLVTNPNCSAGYGVRVMGLQIGQDVEPAEGAVQEVLWTPTSGIDILDPGSCLKVYTWAASTAPTWYWTFKWAEFPIEYLNLV